MALVKYSAERGLSLPEIVFWRLCVAIPLILAFVCATDSLSKLKTKRLKGHGWRAAIGLLGMSANFLMITMLPLPVATTLSFSTPLFAVLLAALVFGEFVGPWRWAAVFIGFAGVAIIAQPGGAATQQVSFSGLGVGLLAALLIALATIQVRVLTRTESSISTVFYFALIGAPAAAVFLPFFATEHDTQDWVLLISIGILGACAQFCAAASLRFAPVSTVMAMDYTAIIWTTLIAWLVWDALPGMSLFLGAPLIVAAGLIISWRENLHKRPAPPSPAEFD